MAQTPSPRAQVAALRAAAQAEAAALAAHARTLDAAGWDQPTWCPGWTVREIVAHLAEGMDRFGQQVQGAGRFVEEHYANDRQEVKSRLERPLGATSPLGQSADLAEPLGEQGRHHACFAELDGPQDDC